MPAPAIWTAPGLLDYFQEVDATDDRRFAFILGAGASVQSGIPMAGQLVDNWLRELHGREDHARLPLPQWATADNLRIPDFVHARAVEWYPQVFARRFEHRPDEGYAYLERILHGKDPSFGYSVLAQLLAGTRHRTVITTNFDNLVSDALAIYTNQLPFVCGHESLAGFVRPNPRRPLVVKIHRDLLLAPKNRSEELAALPEPLAAVLRALFGGFTPIVIGYGGNDGSLMNFLRAMQPGEIPGGIYWCYWGRGAPPCDAALEVVARHRGAIIPIDGFDELMAMLGHRLGFPRMDQVIEQRARERVQRYRSSFEALHQRAHRPEPEGDEPERPAEPAARPAEPVAVLEASSTRDPPAPAARSTPELGATRQASSTDRATTAGPARADAAATSEPPSDSPVQQAIHALVDEPPARDDWWALKLQADREPQPQRRIVAYQEALRRFPEHPELLLGRAAAVARHGLLDQALVHYRSLAARLPDDPRVQLDLAILSALQGALPGAHEHARTAWRLARATERDDGSLQAVVAFVRGLLARLEDRDDTTPLCVLHGLLRTCELRPVGLTDLLAGLLRRLDNPSYRLYRRLLTCLLRQAPLERLQEIPRWSELAPLAPEAAWPDPT